MMPVLADTMPFYMNSIPKNAIGMYQTGENITLYSHPEANSAVIKKLDFSYAPNTMRIMFLLFYLMKKNWAFYTYLISVMMAG